MPKTTVMQLAREASISKSTLVLRGFDDKSNSINGAREYVSEINGKCCGKTPPSWTIHPKLYEMFGVKSTPAFVLAKGIKPSISDFVLISGDIGLPNALKFFSQNSANSEIRAKASEIYTKTFSTN
jgi:type-F conjugative transfer system pilin assembly protein TrbC